MLVPSCCGEGLALHSPLCCSGSQLFYMERALRCARFQPLGVPQKRGTKSCTCFLCLPRLVAQAARSLTGALSPGAARLLPSMCQPQFPPAPVGCMHFLPSASPAPVPAGASPVPVPRVSPRPSRRMLTIQNLRRSLVRNWRPVCSAVGAAVLGAEPAPFPSPPASSGAGLVCSLLAPLDVLRPFVL